MAFTRAASAASSRQAKQELVRLLFGKQYMRKGPEAHRLLDYSIYTHSQLKSAYLQRIQELHPDKRRHETLVSSSTAVATSTLQDNANTEFISLQAAWSRYEEFAKALTKVNNGSREADFTLFGVGCSFSDNDAERDYRAEITDQACRGWFAAGQLGEGNDEDVSHQQRSTSIKQTSLLDDDMFVAMGQDESESASVSKRKTKSLIPSAAGRLKQ